MTERPDILVRPCAEGDVEPLTAAEPPGAEIATRMYARQLRGESVYLLALVRGAVVGSGELLLGEEPELRSLHVHESSRGQGVGSVLVRAAEDRVAERLTLWVGTENPRARALYERLGYTTTGERRTTSYTYVDADGPHQAIEVDERLVKVIVA